MRVLVALLSALASAGCPAERFVIENVTLVAPEEEALSPGAVSVADGRIESLDDGGAGERIDGAGAFVIPGLFDLHAHTEAPDDAHEDATAYVWDEIVWDGDYKWEAFLQYGVTTVRNPGGGQGPLDRRARLAEDPAKGPTLLASGTLLTAPGGHPIGTVWRQFEGDDARYGPLLETLSLIETEAEGRAAVDENADRGADFIKVVFTDALLLDEDRALLTPDELARVEEEFAGIQLTDLPRVSREVLVAIIDDAHARDLPVAVHVDHVSDALFALRAGADTIEHAVHWRSAPADADAFVDELAASDACWTPTLEVFRGLSLGLFADRGELVRRAALAGARIGVGTDTPLLAGSRFGASVAAEMAALVAVGLSPTQVLRAATSDAAACAGLADRGRLTPGSLADVVLTDEDPTVATDALAYERLRLVVHRGRVVRR